MPMGPGYFLLFRRQSATPTPTPVPQPLEPAGVPGGGGWGGPPNEFKNLEQSYLQLGPEARRRFDQEIGVALLLLVRGRKA